MALTSRNEEARANGRARQGLSTLRLGAAVPAMQSSGISSRPFVALEISPWLGTARRRDGRESQ